MLNIAVVGNSYPHVMQYIDRRFKDKIKLYNMSYSKYELYNGDILYMCYDELSKDRYRSMLYDAIIIVPGYESLLDVIRNRTKN